MANGEQRNLRHFYFRDQGKEKPFTSPQSGGGEIDVPRRNRRAHAQKIEGDLIFALQSAEHQIKMRDASIEGGIRGFYLEFDLPIEMRAVLDKLEDRRGKEHIELVSVKPSETNPEQKIAATVFVPESKKDKYLKQVEQYGTEDTPTSQPKHNALVASIDSVCHASDAKTLFTDDRAMFPRDEKDAWWEVWLRKGGRSILEKAAMLLDMDVRDHTIKFPEREIALVRATPVTLGRIIANSDAIAELRLASDTPSVFMGMPSSDQKEWENDLVDRIEPPSKDAPAVCVLDSGSKWQHPLIKVALTSADQQVVLAGALCAGDDAGRQWGGHGTAMCGLALYGDLTPYLVGNQQVMLTHRLESIKILPDSGNNNPLLYGSITTYAVTAAEIKAPMRKRAFCLTTTTKTVNSPPGRPSSWSAALDDLAFGDGDGEGQRLIVVSAGNISGGYPVSQYLNQNDTTPVENPAQSWNALTVGAMTEKCTITDPTLAGYKIFGVVEDLSPMSRTSVTWGDDWPIKPDVVMEGGNYAVCPTKGESYSVDDLSLLTTNNEFNRQPFTVSRDTSAATALVSRMAAQIYADNNDLWPETVRGLIVHSATWTSAMLGHLPANPRSSNKRLLLRRYGFGVPDVDRARRSLNSDVTLVLEGKLQPFVIDGSIVKTRDMIMHDLPWPRDALEQLGNTDVEMRVTLSYFIEPNPGDRGWTKRHRYSSHGLRFDVKRAEENADRFMRRVNRAARDEEDEMRGIGSGSDDGWKIGPILRNRGSIHSDIWKGSAAELASRDGIAVFPVGGWWREKKNMGRTGHSVRYALIVTVKAVAGIDLYTEIKSKIPVEAEVEV